MIAWVIISIISPKLRIAGLPRVEYFINNAGIIYAYVPFKHIRKGRSRVSIKMYGNNLVCHLCGSEAVVKGCICDGSSKLIGSRCFGDQTQNTPR